MKTIKSNTFFKEKQFPLLAQKIDVVCMNFLSPENIGQVMRLASNMGMNEIYYTGEKPVRQSKIQRSATSAYNHTTLNKIDSPTFFKKNKKTVIAIETSENAQNLYTTTLPTECVVLLGNERFGLSAEEISCADMSVYIPVPGITSSLNVSHSFAIFMWEWYRRLTSKAKP